MALTRIVGLFASPYDLPEEGIVGMASATNQYTLTADWAAVSTGEDTVLISLNPDLAGKAEIAIADVEADLGADDRGHQLTPVEAPAINFFNLGDKMVFARKRIVSESVEIIVTAY